MADLDDRYLVKYINGTFAKFYASMLDYFANHLYSRFSWKVIDTFDKAIEYNSKILQYGHEIDKPNRPALAMRPGVPEIDSQFSGMLWRFPQLYGGFGARLFEPLYKDSNITITAPTMRYTGTIDFSALFGSIYELIDFKHILINTFNGYNHYIYPKGFNGYIILPDEITNFTYDNRVTNTNYKLNIPESQSVLIKSINKNEFVYPFEFLPWIKLLSTDDASVRLGGIEDVPDWRLAFSVEYEIEVPSYIIIETDTGTIANVDFNVGIGSNYSSNNDYNTGLHTDGNSITLPDSYGSTNTPNDPYGTNDLTAGELLNPGSSGGKYPPNSNENMVNGSTGNINVTTDGIIYGNPLTSPGEESSEEEFVFTGLFIDATSGDAVSEITENKKKTVSRRYVYRITVDDETSDTNIEIELPCNITDDLLVLISKNGRMNYGEHYNLSKDGLTLTLIRKNISLESEQIIEIYMYQYS